MIQQAIVIGDIDYVLDYYSKNSGIRIGETVHSSMIDATSARETISSPRDGTSSLPRDGTSSVRDGTSSPRDRETDVFLIDDAIILATVHKKTDIVERLLQIKYERAEDIIAQASLSFIRRHPRITWTVPLAIKLIRRTGVHDYTDLLAILECFDYVDYAGIITQSRGHCLPRLTNAYIERFRRHREKIDYLVEKVLGMDDDILFEHIVKVCLHMMSLSLLRRCAYSIVVRGMTASLLAEIVTCRDFTMRHRLGMMIVGRLKGWDKKYMQVLSGHEYND